MFIQLRGEKEQQKTLNEPNNNATVVGETLVIKQAPAIGVKGNPTIKKSDPIINAKSIMSKIVGEWMTVT